MGLTWSPQKHPKHPEKAGKRPEILSVDCMHQVDMLFVGYLML